MIKFLLGDAIYIHKFSDCTFHIIYKELDVVWALNVFSITDTV